MVTLGVKPQAIDLLNFLAEDTFEDAWLRRVDVEMAGVDVSVISIEDFIRAKRLANRPKDRADLALLEEVIGPLPDVG